MRILMPVDTSEFSKAAVAFVASRATLLKQPTELQLVNIQAKVPVRAARALGKDIVQAYYEAEAAKALKPALATLQQAGAHAAARHVVGTVANHLASIVANDRADLIVMGSQGETGLQKLLLGSTATTVAVSSTKPLLIVRGAAPKKDSLKIGIALDGSAYGLAAVRFVAGHRDLFGASPSVSLIHVVPDLTQVWVPGWIDKVVPTGIKPAQAQAMQEAAFTNVFGPAHELLAAAGLKAAEVRRIGQVPADEIAQHATQAKWDVLVMGSLGFGGSRHAVMGSVASRAAAHCKTSLLLVREV